MLRIAKGRCFQVCLDSPPAPAGDAWGPRAPGRGSTAQRALRGDGMPGPPEDPQPPPGSRFGNSGVTGRVQHPRLRSRWCHHQGESCSASCIGPRRCTAPGAQVAYPMGSLVVSGIRVLGRAMLLHCGASALPGVLPVLREGRHLLPTRHKLPPLLWHTECDEYGGQQGEMSQGGILRPSSDSGGKETILTPTGCMAVTIHAAESTRARPRDPRNMVLRGQHCSLFLLQSLVIGRIQACPTFHKSKDA
nr:uncharacterized protein LOC112916191 [Vulpes vulpes]